MDQLTGTLRSYVENDSRRRLWIQTRADWYDSTDYWRNLESLEWEKSVRDHKELASYFAQTVAMLRLHFRIWGRRS